MKTSLNRIPVYYAGECNADGKIEPQRSREGLNTERTEHTENTEQRWNHRDTEDTEKSRRSENFSKVLQVPLPPTTYATLCCKVREEGCAKVLQAACGGVKEVVSDKSRGRARAYLTPPAPSPVP